MIDAESGEHAQNGVSIAMLGADFHQRPRPRRRLRRDRLGRDGRFNAPFRLTFAKVTAGKHRADAGAGESDKRSSIHFDPRAGDYDATGAVNTVSWSNGNGNLSRSVLL